jgi:acyl transferase domain-containing protein
MSAPPGHDDRIAIVGMACRVPGAADVEAFWRNLVDGRESIETVTDHELRAAGVPEALLRDPRYVRAGGFLADVEGFAYKEIAEMLDIPIVHYNDKFEEVVLP